MNKYTITILNKTARGTAKEDLLIWMEMRRPRFTKREFDRIICELFSWATVSCDYDELAADVYCNDRKVFTIDCKTRSDGEEIWSYISTNNNIIRRMNQAC